ncbi:MAG TPA: SUMF1/EgtB/PvdO family nonheme iron enzyme [Candidatus Anammoximicrobium sp.]|nr:SUMF1/EgtB/PvdO family nonheme iron enzyme [Candidatus Anammoximicrobium sp.]
MSLSFRDQELIAGQPASNALGLPTIWTGNFASVFHVQGTTPQQNWALKCFTKDKPGLQERYREIHAHLEQQRQRLPFMVGFSYLPEEVLVRGQRYPLLKMDWVEGLRLDEFLADLLTKADWKSRLRRLCEMWLRLAQMLRDAEVAHGDLQHGNVLLVPVAGKEETFNLRLIDYDGMCVPALRDQPPGEVGHPAYQHPERLARGTHGLEIDRFSHLVIYTTLRCLIAGGRELWERHYDGDRLLLGHQDLAAPEQSAVFRELWQLEEPAVPNLVGHLALAAKGPLEEAPLLSQLVLDSKVVALNAAQQDQVNKWLSVPEAVRMPGEPPESGAAPETSQPAQTRVEAEAVTDSDAAPGQETQWQEAEPAFAQPPLGRLRTRLATVATAAVAWAQTQRQGTLAGIAATVAVILVLVAAGIVWISTRPPVPPMAGIGNPAPPEPPPEKPPDEPSSEPVEEKDAPIYEKVCTLQGHTRAIRAVALSPDAQRALTGSDDATAILWDTATGRPIHTLRGHTAAVTSVTFSADGTRLLTGSEDRSAILWDAISGQKLRDFQGHLGGVTAVALSADGSHALTGSTDARAIVWDSERGEQLRVLDSHLKAITSLVLSPDGARVLTGSWDQTAILWELGTGKSLRSFKGDTAAVLSVAFGPDGKQVLTGSADKTARLWDAATWEVIRTISGHQEPITSVAFCSDGEHVLTASDDTTAMLWDAATGGELFTFQGHDAPVTGVAVSADAHWVLTGSFDKTAVLWKWKVPSPPLAVAPFVDAQAKKHQANWASHLQLQSEITNTIGMKLVLIPPGEFQMGSPDADADAKSGEKPQHRVRITKAFYLGLYEVTQTEYQQVMGANPSHFKESGETAPVEKVSWDEAVEFCRKLSALAAERAAGRVYRLPTEAEWEYACRAGTATRYCFGEGEGDLGEHAWYSGNSGGKTHQVGEKKPNAWGVYDMHGNLSEWCDDWYGDYITLVEDDPTGPTAGSYRVIRGGSWIDGARLCWSAYRSFTTPEYRYTSLGFRVAAVPYESSAEKPKPPPGPTLSSPKTPTEEPKREFPPAPPAQSPPRALAPFGAAEAKQHQERWAAHLNLQAEITNSVKMKLVLIPPGEFQMGSPDSDTDAGSDEKPQHRVRITKPFYLGVYEVTQAEYQQVMGANPSHFKESGETAPVEKVSWDEAVEFCRKLSALAAEQAAGRVYRLPTEAEWEYACRAGTETRYCIGDGEGELGEHAWYSGNSGSKSHRVGEKKPNAWGVYDMHGNVWEWCADYWDGTYDASAVDDPCGPTAGSLRVFRGGSWFDDPGRCRSAFRDRDSPEDRYGTIGFREAFSSVDASSK